MRRYICVSPQSSNRDALALLIVKYVYRGHHSVFTTHALPDAFDLLDPLYVVWIVLELARVDQRYPHAFQAPSLRVRWDTERLGVVPSAREVVIGEDLVGLVEGQ
jgi:hypothetical protein